MASQQGQQQGRGGAAPLRKRVERGQVREVADGQLERLAALGAQVLAHARARLGRHQRGQRADVRRRARVLRRVPRHLRGARLRVAGPPPAARALLWTQAPAELTDCLGVERPRCLRANMRVAQCHAGKPNYGRAWPMLQAAAALR
jgi:hypothetical protein